MPTSIPIPALASSMPPVITLRGPIRPTSRGASVEATKIESVIGRNESPAWIASQPSTSCT